MILSTKIEIVWMREDPPDWSSRLIMWGMGKPYSHVAIIATAKNGIEYLCHAIDKGVCYQSPDSYSLDHSIVRRKTVTLNCSVDELQGFIRGESGKEYSDTQLILIGLKLGWTAYFRNGDSRRICSEFVAAVLKHYCPDYIMPDDLDLVTPADLEDILQPTITE